jgi:uncharacterized protein YceH (UPF0502 family)
MSIRVERPLDRVELRVLGSLPEEEQTPPKLYPLTVAGLLAVCGDR